MVFIFSKFINLKHSFILVTLMIIFDKYFTLIKIWLLMLVIYWLCNCFSSCRISILSFTTISYFKNTKSFFSLLEITFVKLVITFSISASGRDTFHEIASINSFLFVLNKKELY